MTAVVTAVASKMLQSGTLPTLTQRQDVRFSSLIIPRYCRTLASGAETVAIRHGFDGVPAARTTALRRRSTSAVSEEQEQPLLDFTTDVGFVLEALIDDLPSELSVWLGSPEDR